MLHQNGSQVSYVYFASMQWCGVAILLVTSMLISVNPFWTSDGFCHHDFDTASSIRITL